MVQGDSPALPGGDDATPRPAGTFSNPFGLGMNESRSDAPSESHEAIPDREFGPPESSRAVPESYDAQLSEREVPAEMPDEHPAASQRR